jgi:hypothetical protein
MERQFVFGGHGSETSRDRSLISAPQDQWTIRFSRQGASRSAITYPNGKIYVGMDLTGSVTYFGSPSAKERIAADLGDHAHDYTARKQILWESDTSTDAEVRAMEVTLTGAPGE